MNKQRFLSIVRASAWYDLVVTLPFATPWTFRWLYGHLGLAANALNLPGEFHGLNATLVLMANLLGSVVVVWALARLMAPSVRLGRLDGMARVLFASWQIHAWLSGTSTLLLAFTAFELLFGVLQFLPAKEDGAGA